MRADVVVVGAGAAGIFAAWRAATLGAKVVLLEKTPRIGTKILISGGGKCNICHDGPIESVLKAFRANEARFIRPSVYRFQNHEVVKLLTDRGLRVYTRPDGRIFPVDQTAKDVVAILRQILREAGVEIYLNSPVSEIVIAENAVLGVRTKPAEMHKPKQQILKQQYGAKGLLSAVLSDSEDFEGLGDAMIHCSNVVICTGGSSYPNSGTTGDGWNWLRSLGHKIEWIHAALAPIYLELDPYDPALSGVALRDIILKAKAGNKEIARWQNDLLFTHQGVSGPTVLGISRLVAESVQEMRVVLEADLLPLKKHEELQTDLLNENPKRKVLTYLEEFLPERFALKLISQSGVNEETIFAKLDKKSRNRLVETLKSCLVGTVRHVSLEKGEVVAGGVALTEVNPKTMESAQVKGLYLCGEVLDIAGPVGGYNLQAAFSTGFVAGESAALSSRVE
jgi:predicted flavoprotein YhiN